MAIAEQSFEERVEELMKLPYRKVISGSAEEGFLAEVPELEGCFTAGETEQEALELLLDAMAGWFTVSLEQGNPIPQPTAAPDAAYSGKLLLRTSRRLHRLLAEQAREQGVSLNQWVLTLLAEGVGRASGSGPSASQRGGEVMR
jgi:antitoxin HicB